MNRSFFSTPRIVIALVAVAFVVALSAGAFAYFNRQDPIIPVTGESHSVTDLGAGYTLEMTGSTGKIVAPAVVLNPETQKIDLGAGYTLEMTGSTGKIVAPAAALKPDTQKLDLGAGYTLEMTGNTGKIVPPPSSPALTDKPVKMDLGGGYWLIDGKVVKEGSR